MMMFEWNGRDNAELARGVPHTMLNAIQKNPFIAQIRIGEKSKKFHERQLHQYQMLNVEAKH